MKLDGRCKYRIRIKQPFILWEKNKKSRIYYARFENGKSYSTGETDYVKAYNKVLTMIDSPDYEPIAQIKKSNVKKSKSKYDFQNVLQSFFVEGSEFITYENLHGGKFTPQKIKEYNGAIQRLIPFIQDVNSWEDLTRKRLVKLQEQRLQSGVTAKSVNNELSILHRVIKQMIVKEVIEDDPFDKVLMLKHDKQARSCFSIELFKGFYRTIKCKYDLMAYITIATGCRRTEFLNLKQSDLERKNGILLLHVHGTKNEYSDRTIPVPDNMQICLQAKEMYTFSDYDFKQIVAHFCNRFQISYEVVKKQGIVFHSFRKMYKTLLTQANLNTTLVESLMGHSTNNQKSNNVERIYFVSDKADLTNVYRDVLKCLEYIQ